MPAITFNEILKAEQTPTGCGVLVLRDGKVLAGSRIERAGKGKLCGPGGHIEPGETPEEGARREAYEEFGIICNELVPLGVQTGRGSHGRSAVFLCSDFTGEPKTDEEEMTEPQWIRPEEISEEDAYPPFFQSLVLLPGEPIAKTFKEVLKFNPYHDARGRFSSSHGATSFTLYTNSSAGQKAIANIKAKQMAAAGGAKGTGSTETEYTPPATRGHLPYMKGQELIDHTMKECGVTEQEAKDMVREVSGYTDGYATDMRAWQQYGDRYILDEMSSKEARTMSEQVEKFIEKSPKWEGGDIYRGIGVDEDTAMRILDDIYYSGKPFDMKGTSSWTSDKSIADDFSEWSGADVAIIFKAPGTKKGTSIDHISNFSQSEVLVSKDARWDVKRINGGIDDGYLEIEMEEIP